MKYQFYHLILPALLVFSACQNNQQQPAQDTAPPAPAFDESITLPAGFKAIVVADSLAGRARHLGVNANGDIYVQMSRLADGKGLAALRDTSGDGRADLIEYFGSHDGTGLQIFGNQLFCSSDEAVFRYDLKEGQLTPDEASKVLMVGGFPKQNEHASKSFTLDGQGNIYVNVGAPANACQIENRVAGSKGQDPCPLLDLQAGIWKFEAGKTALQHGKDGIRYGTGIRNAVALDWNTATNKLYAVQHGRDQLHQFWPALFTEEQNAELPAEEFFEIEEGDDFG